jgi:DNA-directed RNA polymerase
MNPSSYLLEKVGRVILDSDKAYNKGAKILKAFPEWEGSIERFIAESWDILLNYCSTPARVTKGGTLKSYVKLTNVSIQIGINICRQIDQDETDPGITLGIGDLMLETFLQDGLIDIFREYEGRKAPYVVSVVNQPLNIKPILKGTVFSKPAPIDGLISAITKEPYIKGWSNRKLFKEYLDKPFIQAMENLRQQSWEINKNVLNVLKKNRDQFVTDTLQVVDRHGEVFKYNIHWEDDQLPTKKQFWHMDGTKFLRKKDPRVQRALSKLFEFDQVIKKADLINDYNMPFYQEVSCDYRGRIYYAESFMEFQGSDLARGLYLFNDKRELSEEGLRWLYIHAAACYNQSYTIDELKSLTWTTTDYISYLEDEQLDTISVDKMTLQDRVNWVEHNLDAIRLAGLQSQLFPEAEKPVSYYAACVEIAEYHLSKLSGIPYMSGLPIPIDGSNNGWQHLAAMSKDKQAGTLVSLTPTPIQKDFYVAVAKSMIELMPDWFEERQIPMKHIRKGIAKRGSMTRAYSAGKKKIQSNMYDDCHVEGYTNKYNITEADTDLLAGNLIKAINTVCSGPLKTTKYLQKIIDHELNSGEQGIEWVTPSGFPVKYKVYLQHERRYQGTIKGINNNKSISHVVKVDIRNRDTNEKVPCRRSFASGISPNVVHSYDASHMANTIRTFNGSFGAVHDSFSTHANDVDKLQRITKEEFIKQYDTDNFFNVLQDNLMKHKDTFTFKQPDLGDLNIADINDSQYFFC